MQCPKCQQETLVPFQSSRKNTILDRCEQCDGLWLDPGELEKLTENAARLTNLPVEAKGGKRLCPRCQQAMHVSHFPKTSVLVDICEGCYGIWLDSTELAAIREQNFKDTPVPGSENWIYHLLIKLFPPREEF